MARVGSQYWQPKLTQLLELKRARSKADKELKGLEDEIREELGHRGGEAAIGELAEVVCHNLDLKESGEEDSDMDLVELGNALAGCRIVTQGRVCFLKVRKVKRSTHAARVDVMVAVALRTCAEPGCPALVSRGRCPKHQRPAFEGAARRELPYHTARWQKARARYLYHHEWCVKCEAEGRMTPSTSVDHLDYADFWDEARWRALCKPCHDAHSARTARSRRG